jgi:hypothetical protein
MAVSRHNLSSDSLFHFVSEMQYMMQILGGKAFKARYVYEKLPSTNIHMATPIKCFCDIPLGMVKGHITNYGSYGIGITKSFAKRKGISPVFYVHNNSDTIRRFGRLFKSINEEVLKDSPLLYFKLDEEDKKRYYDEREWRWVPEKPEIFIKKENINIDNIKVWIDDLNKGLKEEKSKYLLPFTYDDISYIFVKNERFVGTVIERINRIISLKGKENELERGKLIAKIVTAKQIERDF